VLGLCASSNEGDSAVLEVLAIMKRQGLTQERSSYRACLQACFEVGNGASAKEILTSMEQALVKPEPADISLVVAAMCRNNKSEAGFWKEALSLLTSTAGENTDGDGNKDKQVVPVEAYDTILSCMVKARQWKQAVQLLRLMEEEEGSNPKSGRSHPKPELSTYLSVIECCVAASQAEQAVQVLYSMKDRGLQPTLHAFELVISALSRKLLWRRALQLLDLMDATDVPKTVVTYNTVISACARAREVGMAKSLLAKMRKEGVRPNVISFNSVISACASTSRWKDALAVVDQCHREPGVSPDIYTYTNAMR
jgi:pentatricopeptide repeat protein